jgi:hypothetical protein
MDVLADSVDVSKNVPSIARSREQREELAQHIFERIEQGQAAKGGLTSVWQSLEAIHRNEPPSEDVAPARGMAAIHLPFSQPRIDMLGAQVCSVVGKQKPIMLCESGGDDAASSRTEACLHAMWSRGGFDRALRDAVQIAANTNKAIWRLVFQVDAAPMLTENSDQIEESYEGHIRYAGLKIECIHPKDFVVAPASLDGLQSASVVGHRFYQRVQRIKELQKVGVYFAADQDIVGGDSPVEHDDTGAIRDSRTSPNVFSDEPDTSLVECYELIVRRPSKEGGFERYYRAVIAHKQQFLLDLEEWPYSRPPYFTSGFLTDVSGFWGGRSVARSLAPLQDEYDRIESLIYNGAYMSAMPPIIGPRISDEKYSQYQPGDWIEGEPGAQPFSPSINFRADVLQEVKADLERLGDMAARISTNSLGSEEAKVSVTATQTQAIQSGVATGLSEYIAEFTLQFSQMASFSCELLADNYVLWRPFYAGQVGRDDLKLAYEWESNGKSPASTPMARIAALQQLWAVAMNPMSGLDPYEIAKLMLANSGIPGADKLQQERPQPTPNPLLGGQISGGNAPAVGDMGTDQGPSLTPQRTQQGESLEPIAASLVRPGAIGTPDASGGTTPNRAAA